MTLLIEAEPMACVNTLGVNKLMRQNLCVKNGERKFKVAEQLNSIDLTTK